MRKKGILKQAVALTLALGISLSGSLVAYAAEWKQDTTGWKVQNEDGSFIANAWYQSPTSLLWYYISESGYMLHDTTTPDGYSVGSDGVWLITDNLLDTWKDKFRNNWSEAYKGADEEAKRAEPNLVGPVTYTFTMDIPDNITITEQIIKELCKESAGKCYPRSYYKYKYSIEGTQLTITATSGVFL